MAVPSVNISVTNNVNLLQQDAGGSAFFIGTASWGPVNVVREYTGGSEIASLFKGGNLVNAVNFGVLGGLENIKVYRIAADDKVKATYTLQSSAVDRIKIDGKYYGTYGNNIQFVVTTIGSNKAITISDGKITEIFDNAGAGYSSNTLLVAAINDSTNGSSLVDATLLSDTVLVQDYSATSLAGGDDGTTNLVNSDYTSVITANPTLEYDFLLVPDTSDNALQQSIATLMETREINNKEVSIFVTGIAVDEAYNTTIARTATTNRGRMFIYGPGSVVYNDTKYGANIVAAYFAGLLATKQIGDSMTHDPIGLDMYVSYTDENTNTRYYSAAQELALVNAGFTVINKIGNYNGVIQAVSKITDKTNSFYEQVVRLEADYIVKNLYDILNPFIGQRNSDEKRLQMKSLIDTFMGDLVSNQGIVNYNSEVIESSATVVTVNIDVIPMLPINTIDGNVTLTLTL